MSTACCLLSAVCCLLSAVCCLLFAVCCLLSAGYWVHWTDFVQTHTYQKLISRSLFQICWNSIVAQWDKSWFYVCSVYWSLRRCATRDSGSVQTTVNADVLDRFLYNYHTIINFFMEDDKQSIFWLDNHPEGVGSQVFQNGATKHFKSIFCALQNGGDSKIFHYALWFYTLVTKRTEKRKTYITYPKTIFPRQICLIWGIFELDITHCFKLTMVGVFAAEGLSDCSSTLSAKSSLWADILRQNGNLATLSRSTHIVSGVAILSGDGLCNRHGRWWFQHQY